MNNQSFGTDEADYWERLRARLVPKLHDVLSRYGLYAEMDADRDEYYATVLLDPESFEEQLAAWGFTRNPVAGYKTRWDGAEEIGSWRRCYTETDEGDIVAGDMFSKWQLHVRLFPGPEPGQVDVHAHWEINWAYDPFAHYRGTDHSIAEGHDRLGSFLENLGADMYYDRLEQ